MAARTRSPSAAASASITTPEPPRMFRESPPFLVPDEMEVADAVSSGELLRLARRAGQRRAEEQVDVLGEDTGELRERAVVHELEHPLLAGRRLLSLARRRDLRVLAHGEPETDACSNERGARPQRHRQPEREALDRPTRDELAVERHGREPARDRHGAARRAPASSCPELELSPPKTCAPKLSQFSPRGSEKIRPPTRSAASSTTTSTVAECMGGRQPGDPTADDDDVLHR